MKTRTHTKMLHEGKYVAEVKVTIFDSNEGWSPYISLEDALMLDDLREMLKCDDVESAKKLAKIYTLSPVAA